MIKHFVGIMLLIFLGISQGISQNIGIGTDNPEGILHISKDNSIIGPSFIGTGLNDILVDFNPDFSQSSTEISWNIEVFNSGPDPNLINIFPSEGAPMLSVEMTHSGIVLGNGVSIGFVALSGHTYDDVWKITFVPGMLDQLIVKDGKVGIGTDSPVFELDIFGDANFTGDLYQNGSLFVPAASIDGLSDGINNEYNLFLGTLNGEVNAGSQNLFIGNRAGKVNSSGSNNVFLGFGAGENNQTGSGNVFIGNQVSSAGSESNRLKINNAANVLTKPLIYGEFDNKKVFINRTSEISPQEVFGISRDVVGADFGGMYVETRGSATSIPFYGFAINNISKAWIEFDGNSNDVGINNTNSNFRVKQNTATKPFAGSWAANSDARLKKNIRTMKSEEMLEKVKQMHGVTYEWNDDKTDFVRPKGEQIGFIAQDLQKVWPGKVARDHQGYLMTAYGDYDPVFVEAIKALSDKIDQQEKKIEALNQKIENLQKSRTLYNKH